ncbi:MAG: 2Fe-2S iron-sulfur cluster-binding protein [Litorimonas sp.]
MTKITFIEHAGTLHEVEAQTGQTLAQAALDNGVPGIDGDCGGNCACATCHVFMPETWRGKVAPQSDMEKEMLELTPELAPNSRLACQITVTAEMDGIQIRLPEFQM